MGFKCELKKRSFILIPKLVCSYFQGANVIMFCLADDQNMRICMQLCDFVVNIMIWLNFKILHMMLLFDIRSL